MSTQHIGGRVVRVIATAAVAALAIGLAGCSGTASGGGDSTQLNVLLHSNPPTDKALTAMTEAFEKDNPGISVKLDFVQTNDLPATRTSRLAAGKVDVTEGSTGIAAQPLPDYVVNTPESDWIKGVDAGNWVDMTDESFVANYLPDVVSALAVDGKTYQIPTSLNYYTGVYYNKDLFKQAGVKDEPKTWSDFEAAMKKIEDAGLTAFSAGGKDSWPIGLIPMASLQSAYPSVDDRIALEKSLWDGTVKWNDPKLVDVMDQVKTIYDYSDPTFAGVDYATAEGQFAGGQVAMTIDGTWAATQFLDTNPALKLGFFPFPGSENADDNAALGGKIDFTLAIPTSSKNKDAALKWVAYFSDKDNYADFATTGGIIPAQPDVALSPALDSVKPYLTSFDLGWGDIFHNSNASPVTLNYAQLSPMGKLATAKDAQDAAQQEWSAAITQ